MTREDLLRIIARAVRRSITFLSDRQALGAADTVLRDWDVCVAQYLPAGVTLTAVAVEGDQLVADFDVDGAIATDPALRENGTCA